jgi:protein-tyrosine-phosphatase
MSATQTLLFVYLHGAGMSRIAAAYFNRAAPTDWHAVSAGVPLREEIRLRTEALAKSIANSTL